MVFQIKYKFINDRKSYTCHVTYEQYSNLKKVPSIEECKVLKENQEENLDGYLKEMQIAINELSKNNSSHIRRLSENI